MGHWLLACVVMVSSLVPSCSGLHLSVGLFLDKNNQYYTHRPTHTVQLSSLSLLSLYVLFSFAPTFTPLFPSLLPCVSLLSPAYCLSPLIPLSSFLSPFSPPSSSPPLPISSQPVLILYGSQTGTAAETAAAAGRALRRLHLRVRVRSMDAIDVRELPRTPWLLCVCSTTGQGEEPDNMRALWRFLLRRALPTNSLEHTRFAVFGLGDSSYPKFNFVAKKLHKRLLSLGATTLAPLGLADDQHPLGPHAALDPWLFQVTTHLLQHFPLPLPPVPPTALLPPALPLRLVAPDDKRARQCRTAAMTYGNAVCEQATDRPYVTAARGSTHAAPQALAAGGVPDRTHPLLAPLRQNKRMTPEDHFQDVRHVILDTQHCPALTYNPGDVAYVMVCVASD